MRSSLLRRIMSKRNERSYKSSNKEWILVILLAGIFACSHEVATKPVSQAKNLPRAVILPVGKYVRDEKTGESICPICQERLPSGDIDTNEMDAYGSLFQTSVEETNRFDVAASTTAEFLLGPSYRYPAQTTDLQFACDKA